MIDIPAHAVEETLRAFVRRWLKLLAAGRWQEACGMIDEPNRHGMTWTPGRIWQAVEGAFGPGCRFRSRHPEGLCWTDPTNSATAGTRNSIPTTTKAGMRSSTTSR